MDKIWRLILVLNTILLFLGNKNVLASQPVSNSERYRTMDPNKYSYRYTTPATTTSSVQGCAFDCNRDPFCDGFYYGRYDTTCVLGSHFLRRETSLVDPDNFRLYIRDSYVLTTECPTHQGFRIVTAGAKTFCFQKNDLDLVYTDAQAYCEARGSSLLYMGGDIASYMHFLPIIFGQLEINWSSGWGGAQKALEGDWIWAYSGTAMTSHEYGSYTWSIDADPSQKCMSIDQQNLEQARQKSCMDDDQSICEIVLF